MAEQARPLPSAALPSAALPSAALPSAALPSAALPSAALPSAALPIVALLTALGGRLLVLLAAPTPYAFDAFQRWAGREHLLVRDWLPGTQALVWAVAALGGGHFEARAALALVAAVGVAAGALVARRMAGEAAGWLFIPLGLFGPTLCWTTALYQEGTFLAVLLGGLALGLRAMARSRKGGADKGRGADEGGSESESGGHGWLWADLLIGLVGLIRYEGWPVVLLYLAWRRSPRALLCAWGIALWLVIRAVWGQGYAPSPVDYADWAGLGQRFSTQAWLHSASRLLSQAWDSGGLAVCLLGLLGAVLAVRHKRPAAGLLLAITLAQGAALVGWMAGLQTAIVRMQVVPVTLMGLLAAVGLGPYLAATATRRALTTGVAVLAAALGMHDGVHLALRAERALRWEQALVDELGPSGPGGPWTLQPRSGLGTRDRHDGCEIIQGLTSWQAGRDFQCEPWRGSAWAGESTAQPILRVRWAAKGYRLDWLRPAER